MVLMQDLLLWQVVPLYPGAHSHVPSSGEQEAPFLQLQGMEQFGPQRPSAHTLSQWIPTHIHTHTDDFLNILHNNRANNVENLPD